MFKICGEKQIQSIISYKWPDQLVRPWRMAAVETLQPRRLRQDGVRGRVTASGTAGGRRPRSGGREWGVRPRHRCCC